MKDNIQDLESGDSVVVCEPKAKYTLTTVDRVTNTQILVNGRKYRKLDGSEINGIAWKYTFIKAPLQVNQMEETYLSLCS